MNAVFVTGLLIGAMSLVYVPVMHYVNVNHMVSVAFLSFVWAAPLHMYSAVQRPQHSYLS